MQSFITCQMRAEPRARLAAPSREISLARFIAAMDLPDFADISSISVALLKGKGTGAPSSVSFPAASSSSVITKPPPTE